MSAIAFDTLKFAKRLKEAGFTEQQAEALADAEAEFIEQNLATKRDIADIKRDIKELEVTLRNEMKQLDVILRGIEDLRGLVPALGLTPCPAGGGDEPAFAALWNWTVISLARYGRHCRLLRRVGPRGHAFGGTPLRGFRPVDLYAECGNFARPDLLIH